MKGNLRRKFVSPTKGLLVRDFIDYLEEELLNFDKFPEEYLLFVEEIFSNIHLYSARNSWKILHFLPSENLTVEQFQRLGQVIRKHFFSYSEYMLCDISCDFVARTCSSKYALELFEKFLEYEFDDIHRRSILVGLNVLLVHGCDTVECEKKARLLADRISTT